jgi:hypothetical protein
MGYFASKRKFPRLEISVRVFNHFAPVIPESDQSRIVNAWATEMEIRKLT